MKLHKMALLSKFLEDFGNRTGIPLIGITRVVYSAAILGYVANVVIPNIKISSKQSKGKAKIEKNEDETKILSVSKENSQLNAKPKGPAVNRYNSKSSKITYTHQKDVRQKYIYFIFLENFSINCVDF